MGLSLTVAPTAEPVSLTEAKLQLRVDTSDEDTLISAMIEAARLHFDGRDGVLGRCLMPQTWVWTFDEFPSGDGILNVPLPPLLSVTSLQYRDSSQVLQTLTEGVDYTVDTSVIPGQIVPEDSGWPGTYDMVNAVTITFRAGYESGNSPEDGAGVPAPIRQAIKLLVGHMYQNREAVVTGTIVTEMKMAVDALTNPYRIYAF